MILQVKFPRYSALGKAAQLLIPRKLEWENNVRKCQTKTRAKCLYSRHVAGGAQQFVSAVLVRVASCDGLADSGAGP